ncbi:stAR-related lipid transfer protein 7, mitochondrial-like isoform X1 [Diabrotica undecimpunctata]|uniref:stAR-related lipid transfer protein 7, mitochondrial-like isoform X1 n=1 Tax=Diabrotica undecimpunctata TaxID=50387 RepID=UPI003B631BF3
MYPRGPTQSILPLNSNLKNVFKTIIQKQFLKYDCTFRQKFKNLQDFNRRFQDIIKTRQFYKIFLEDNAARNNRRDVFKVWVHHCECVLAQRMRRCQQMFTLYSKWWEKKAFEELIKKMRQNIAKRTKDFALGTVGISAYNWDKYRIQDEEIRKNEQEFEYVKILKESTICLACDTTKTPNSTSSHICECGHTQIPKTYDDWVLFIEKPDLVVWRRLHHSGSGQYEYKVYGSYNDVSAEDFLNVQVDIDYRRKWDTSAVILEHAESDPLENSNSDVIYWELLWPRLFVNRDYVFNRRYLVDNTLNTIFILNRSTEHPKFPKYAEKYRIDDYWSCMVIKPYDGDMTKPGIQFVLTYYDNPGVSIPSSVTTWVAMRAMPEFLEKLREATKHYKNYCLKEGTTKACNAVIAAERAAEAQRQKDRLDYCSYFREVKSILIPENEEQDSRGKENASGNIKDTDSSEVSSVQHNSTKRDSPYNYLNPLYYFFQ